MQSRTGLNQANAGRTRNLTKLDSFAAQSDWLQANPNASVADYMRASGLTLGDFADPEAERTRSLEQKEKHAREQRQLARQELIDQGLADQQAETVSNRILLEMGQKTDAFAPENVDEMIDMFSEIVPQYEAAGGNPKSLFTPSRL